MDISTVPVVSSTLVRTLVFWRVMTNLVKAGMVERKVPSTEPVHITQRQPKQKTSATAV